MFSTAYLSPWYAERLIVDQEAGGSFPPVGTNFQAARNRGNYGAISALASIRAANSQDSRASRPGLRAPDFCRQEFQNGGKTASRGTA